MADWLDGNGGKNRADVQALLDSQAFEGIVELVDRGALVSLSTTKDGGALGVTVTVSGRWRRDYFRESEELIEWLAEALPAVTAAVEAASAAADRGSRRRGL